MLQSAKKLDHAVDAPSLIGSDNAPGHVERALDIDPTLSTAWLGLVSVMVSAEIDVTPAGLVRKSSTLSARLSLDVHLDALRTFTLTYCRRSSTAVRPSR